MRVHFIGIGGVSVGQLAMLLEGLGHEISGSDAELMGHDAQFVAGAELVVYSSAIGEDNVELAAARARNIPTLSRAQLLGALSKQYNKVIAAAGTHGKSTVTGMLWQVFKAEEITVHLGARLQSYAGLNPVKGREFFITEACEYKRSFLNLAPATAIILNTELDHTDCYSSLEDILSAFLSFANKASEAVVINSASPLLAKLRGRRNQTAPKIITFGLDSSSDYAAVDLTAERGCYSFTVKKQGRKMGRCSLSVQGIYNVHNALAAIATGDLYGINWQNIISGISEFKGISRRFELIGTLTPPTLPLAFHPLPPPARPIYNVNIRQEATEETNTRGGEASTRGERGSGGRRQEAGVSEVYSDYAHHPREVESAIRAARLMGDRRLVAVFEPHTYTRTRSFFGEFCKALGGADVVILLPIYAAREGSREGEVSSLDILLKLRKMGKKAVYFATYAEAAEYIEERFGREAFILVMGAGSVDKLARHLGGKRGEF